MSKLYPSQQQKLAEKLTILNDRGIGLLTRIYNIKKACDDPKCKPPLLNDRAMKPAIDYIIKKFPIIDVKSNPKELSVLTQTRGNELIKSLTTYYLTFVDILEFKDHVSDVLTTIDACQVQMDIMSCFDLTKHYFDLMTTYTSLMILLSRVEDRKPILGLCYCLSELNPTVSTDPNFPRLGTMICDFEHPIKKLSEDFQPHTKVLCYALMSLLSIYSRRTFAADKWRNAKMLSLVTAPKSMLSPINTQFFPCEYLSVDSMDRWIIFGYTLCHSSFPNLSPEMWKIALSSNFVITIYRDEVIYPHDMIDSFFKLFKGYSKRISDVREYQNAAVTNSFVFHKDRRMFLSNALRELAVMFADEPGLLAPKVLYLFMGLSFARDEILWLVRHTKHPLPKSGKKPPLEYNDDSEVAELLFRMQELKLLTKKYTPVIQKYYILYLSQYDCVSLSELVQKITMCAEEESLILSDIVKTLGTISDSTQDNGYKLLSIRLDWFRLQAYMNISKPTLAMSESNKALFYPCMNQIVFHTKMVDSLPDMLYETSDLSIFCHSVYLVLFEHLFQSALTVPDHLRYCIAFPMICADFPNCTHEMCPEEKNLVSERALKVCNVFLDELAKKAKNSVKFIALHHCNFSEKLLTSNVSQLAVEAVSKKQKKAVPTNVHNLKRPVQLSEVPGDESKRKNLEETTELDISHQELSGICTTISFCPTVTIAGHIFSPREFLHAHLEKHFANTIVSLATTDGDGQSHVTKPSQCLLRVRAYMSVFQWVENYVTLDTSRLFNNVLLQQTQMQNNQGAKTLTRVYTQFYINLLKKSQFLVYSHFSNRFILACPEASISFSPEEYTCMNELAALAELIGPSGIKYLLEGVAQYVCMPLVENMRQHVKQNRDCLHQIRTNFDNPDHLGELVKQLKGVETLLTNLTACGMALAFHSNIQEALQDVLSNRTPFLLTSIKDFYEHAPDNISFLMQCSELASSAGIKCDVDPMIVNSLGLGSSLRMLDDDYNVFCLLLVFIAVAIPELVKGESNILYKPYIEGHANNAHCIAFAIARLVPAMFYSRGSEETGERLKEFLALSSSNLLKLGQDEKVHIQYKESVYILLDMIVDLSPQLTMDLLESCFPFILLRNSYHTVYKKLSG